MNNFKVGDRVTMSEEGAVKWGRNPKDTNNPWDVYGEVVIVRRWRALPVMVTWDNGRLNSYREVDLDSIYDIFENE